MEGAVIPVHLVVHVLGLTVAAGLALLGVARRHLTGPTWPGLLLGGVLLGATHLAAGALLVGDAGWPLYARAAGYAAIAVGAVGRLAGTAPTVMVFAAPGAHLAAAAAGIMAALAAGRGVLGRGREVAPLVAGLALWATADLVGAPGVAENDRVAAALSVAGSLSAGWWLSRRMRSSLMGRFASSSMVVLLVVVVGLASAVGLVSRGDLLREQLVGLADRAEARAVQVETEWTDELRVLGSAITGDAQTANLEAVEDGRLADLDEAARAMVRLAGVDVALVLDRDGVVVGSHDDATGARLARRDTTRVAGDAVVAEALAGSAAAAVTTLGETPELAALAAVPIAPRDGPQLRLDRQVGALVLIRRADDQYVRQVSAQTGADAAVVVATDRATVVSTLAPEDGDTVGRVVLQGETSDPSDPSVLRLADGRDVFVAASPVQRDRVVAHVALVQEAGSVADLEAQTTRRLFLLALGGMAAAGLLAAASARRTTEPVARLTEAAEHVAAGDLDVRLASDRPDEVGRLAAAFDEMTVALADREQALRDAATTEGTLRRRLEVVTGSMSEALLAVDRDGSVVTANAAARRLLGEAVGHDVDRVLVGTDEAGAPLHAALGGGSERAAAAARGVVRSGRRFTPVAATAAPLIDGEGHALGRVYVLRDISGEVEIERMKTEFLSNISHELRTPLTPIKGYSEVLRSREVPGERVRVFADQMAVSAERLERIIGMLVDYAALEAGRMRVTLAPTDLGAVVAEVLEGRRADDPDRALTCELEEDLPQVRVDRDLLRRVLEELVDNAVKFSDGPVSVTARRDGDVVAVVVRDEGVGIEPEQLESILSDFHQGDGSSTRRHGGLGLGLSIVRRIVERFEADLEFRSAPGEGTEVVLRLPVVRS